MKHIIYPQSITLLLLSITVCLSSPYHSPNTSSESLTIHNDYYQLQFSYDQHSATNIPQSLTSLLRLSSIHQLTLLMGVSNPSYINQQQDKHNIYTTTIVLHQGISLMLKNSSSLLKQNYQSIAQSLSISRSQQYMAYIQQSQTLFISNPNDKFCSQHLNTIIDLFLPCGTNSGIGSIINEKSFFVGKMFIGLRLYWNIDQETIYLTFMMDRFVQQVNNYMKVSQEKRLSRRCMYFSKLAIITPYLQNQKQQSNSTHFHDDDNSIALLTTTSITAQFVSNYYSEEKTLFMKVDLDKLMRELQSVVSGSFDIDNSTDGQIVFTARLKLPQGFQMQDVSYTCENCASLLANITMSSQSLYLIKATVSKRILNQQQEQQLLSSSSTINSTTPQLIYKFSYLSSFKPFQEYENIAGGGEEFMNVPFTIQIGNNSTVIIMSNSLRDMFDRLLQPDFSIPFKTITFTLVIIGYLWISIWRAFYAQNQYYNKCKPSLKQQHTESSINENQHNQQFKKTIQPTKISPPGRKQD